MKYFLLIFSISFVFELQAQRTFRNEFLNLGAGARDMALAGSSVAHTRDETSAYRNPAGLQAIKKKYALGLMHAEYFAGLSKYDYASFTYKSNDSTAYGFTFLRSGTDDIPNTLSLYDANGQVNYDRISYFSAADYAVFLSYSTKTTVSGFAWGAQAKIIYRHLGPFADAYGFGFDAGVQYRFGQWQTGAMLKDASSTFNAWFFDNSETREIFEQTGNEIPRDTVEFSVPQLNTGLAREFSINKDFNLLAETGLVFSFDGQRHSLISAGRASIAPHLGLEGSYKNLVFLRAGFGKFALIPDFDKERLAFEPGIGLGLRLFNFRIDYALINIGGASGALYSNIFSLAFEFN